MMIARDLQARVGARAPRSLSGTSSHEPQWAELDEVIRNGWEADTSIATEVEIRKDPSGELLFLPFPYVSPTPAGSLFSFMFGWDTDFVSRALMAHGMQAQARHHLLNYLFMIDRYGYMPNANAADMKTRSQTPLIADTIWRYYLTTRDRDFLYQAYPRLARNYREYWSASHHQTPIGLATNRDLGDSHLPAPLAAEAEVGLDWTPIFGGDVRRCVPLLTNCALVRYARNLANIAREIGREAEAQSHDRDASRRGALIRQYCWSEEAGFFLEYDFVARKQLPCRSDCSLWPLWAGVATQTQAKRLVHQLHCIEQPFGLSSTDQSYPLPRPEEDYGPDCRVPPNGVAPPDAPAEGVIGGTNPLQWMYPAGWAPSHLIAVEGLDTYGHTAEGTRVASKFLGLVMQQYERTGHLWEKYNVVDGSLVLPNARCGNVWMHGWTAAAVVLLGRRIFKGVPLWPT